MRTERRLIKMFIIFVSLSIVVTSLSAALPYLGYATAGSLPTGQTASNSALSGEGAFSNYSTGNTYLSTGIHSGVNRFEKLVNKMQSTISVRSFGLVSSGYSVTFNALNRVSGVSWSVEVYSSSLLAVQDFPLYDHLLHENYGLLFNQSTNGSSITASLPLGTYYYFAGPSNTMIGPYLLAVTGTQSVTVTFPNTYATTFTETGVASGTAWNVYGNSPMADGLSAMFFGSSSSLSLTEYLPVGNFFVDYGAGGMLIESHYIHVSGSGMSFSITMPQLTQVAFKESSLTSGSKWEIVGGGTTGLGSSVFFVGVAKASSDTLELPQGSYFYSASFGGISYSSSNEICVGALSKNVSVSFPALFNVQFNESGLLSGLNWNVVVESSNYTVSASNSTYGSSITFPLPEGKYTYSAGEAGADFVSGNITLTATGASVGISFPAVYHVTLSETGLFTGYVWSATAYVLGTSTSFYNVTKGVSISTYLPDGEYSYYFVEEQSYPALLAGGALETVSSATLEFNVTGSPLTVSVVFPHLTEVNFSQTGMSSGYVWGVSASNYSAAGFSESYSNSTPASYAMTAYLINGTFVYYGTAGDTFMPSLNLTVAGKLMDVTVAFPKLYTVTFSVKGLPQCVGWYISIYSNVSYFNSTESSAMTAYLPNGTYTYALFLSNGAQISSTFVVSGASETISITIPATYNVTFVETGLPAGTTWYASVNGSLNYSTSTTVGFYEFNGTYDYTVSALNYVANVSSGSITVAGTKVSVDVSFVPSSATYFVMFSETGLANGIQWSVTLNGSTSSGVGPISFLEPNGSYQFTINSVLGYASNITSGNVTVYGASVVVNVTFTSVSKVIWEVTFNETGLPSGYTWNVSLTGSSNGVFIFNGSTTITVSSSFLEPNGSYQFSANASGYVASPSGGNFTINGANVYFNVAFIYSTLKTYGMTFVESGLPSGASWSITLNGTATSSTATSLSFDEPNGSYKYSIAGPANFTASPSSGTLTVSGSAVSLNVQFSAVQKVYFTGTVSPSNASLYINGKLVPTNAGTFNVTLYAGQSYEIEFVAPGYKPYYDNTTLSSGTTQIAPLTLNLAKQNVTAKSTTSTEIIIGLIVVVAIIAGAAVVLMKTGTIAKIRRKGGT